MSKAQDIVQEALSNVADALGEPFYTAATSCCIAFLSSFYLLLACVPHAQCD